MLVGGGGRSWILIIFLCGVAKQSWGGALAKSAAGESPERPLMLLFYVCAGYKRRRTFELM